jgi:hypothetical protein
MIGNVVTFGFGLGGASAIPTLGFGPGPAADQGAGPTWFAGEVAASNTEWAGAKLADTPPEV